MSGATNDALDDLDDVDHRRLEPRVPGQQPVERMSTRSVFAIIFAVVVFVYLVRSILLPFALSGTLAYVCTPLVETMSRRLRLNRTVAAVIVFFVLVGIAAGIGYFVVPSIGKELATTVGHLQQTIERGAEAALGHGRVKIFGTETSAPEIAKASVAALRGSLVQVSVIGKLAIGGFAAIFGMFLAVVLLFYFLTGGPQIAKGLLWLVPPRQRPLVHAMWRELDPVLLRYFTGVALVVVYASAAAYVGLGLFLHLPNAIVLAILTGLLEMIPVVGPGASALIAGLAALDHSLSVGSILGYIAYATALRLSIDQMIGPLVLGRVGRVHPVLIIFCFLAGGLLFDVVGVFLSVPVALTIRTVLSAIYEEPSVEETPPKETS